MCRIEDRPVPKPAPGQVLVEIAATGICGSDVHYYEHGRIGDYVVRDPMIIGHESAGTVNWHHLVAITGLHNWRFWRARFFGPYRA
jgi:threonine dehydrogenase-like Zn-dependent dehydrogenase